jgi:hypothetical protein
MVIRVIFSLKMPILGSKETFNIVDWVPYSQPSFGTIRITADYIVALYFVSLHFRWKVSKPKSELINRVVRPCALFWERAKQSCRAIHSCQATRGDRSRDDHQDRPTRDLEDKNKKLVGRKQAPSNPADARPRGQKEREVMCAHTTGLACSC